MSYDLDQHDEPNPLEYDDDAYCKDDLGPPKEEPDCYRCTDSGIDPRTGRACCECCPSRLRVWWWTVQHRFRHLRIRRRSGDSPADDPWADGPPF